MQQRILVFSHYTNNVRHGHGLGASMGWVGSEIFAYEMGWVGLGLVARK